MDPQTVKRLIDLNRQFYQTFAVHFSNTRERLQPGVQRILAGIPLEARILDLGCGNGELCRTLTRAGYVGSYVGLDYSKELLEIAASPITTSNPEQSAFIQADITSSDWEMKLPSTEFDIILAFAVLHHIPSVPLRSQIVQKVHTLLAQGGVFIHSEWQFMNSPKLKKRIQSWEDIDLSPEQADPGDYLLDWRRGGYGLRYVHHFELDELMDLARSGGFTIKETFLSDGEGGQLGLYQIWEPH